MKHILRHLTAYSLSVGLLAVGPSYAEEVAFQGKRFFPEGYNRVAESPLPKDWKVSLTADFLYWQALEDNLQYGSVDLNAGVALSESNTIVFPYDLLTLNPNHSFHPGSRVSLKLTTPKQHWETEAIWTHLASLNSKASDVRAGGIQHILTSNVMSNTSINSNLTELEVYGTTKNTWKCLYDTFDLLVGKTFTTGKYTTLKPKVGIRGALIRQLFEKRYSGTYIAEIASSGQTASFAGTIDVTDKNRNWGLGWKGGVDIDWMLPQGFHLFNQSSLSLLVCSFSTKHRELNPEKLFPSSANRSDASFVRNDTHTVMLRPNLENLIGVGWGKLLNAQYYLDLALAYETNIWWGGHNAIYVLDRDSRKIQTNLGDLGFHGALFKARLDF